MAELDQDLLNMPIECVTLRYGDGPSYLDVETADLRMTFVLKPGEGVMYEARSENGRRYLEQFYA